jgi:hypothetical protein
VPERSHVLARPARRNHERFQQEAERVKPLLNAALSLGDLKKEN